MSSTRIMGILPFLLAVACTPTPSVCGEGGDYYEDDLGRYCAYVVIVGGFTCPTELPQRHMFGGFTVCADHMIPETGPVPDALCVRLGSDCPMPAPPMSDAGADADAGAPPDAGAPMDAGSDAAVVDAGAADTGTADAGTADCDPVLQTGCGAGDRCTWVAGVAGFTNGDTRCVPDGTIPVFQPCTASAGGVPDDCVAGTFCGPSADLGCTPICDPAATSPSHFCEQAPTIFDDRPNAGYRYYPACTLPWHECPAPEGCFEREAHEAGAGIAFCHLPDTPGAVGATCVTQRDCDRLNVCIRGTCERLCLDPSFNPELPDTCPAGTACVTEPNGFPGTFDPAVQVCR
ncbi:MAG: hypothetical protein KC619_12085 [Myxococcales bacterium]|nr:hypothetical protein [Myxococcales bacterium]